VRYERAACGFAGNPKRARGKERVRDVQRRKQVWMGRLMPRDASEIECRSDSVCRWKNGRAEGGGGGMGENGT